MIDRFLPALKLPGASWRERLIAALGALLGIGLSGLASSLVAGSTTGTLLLLAPIGASAVLLFAVPSSPLGQPWSIVGGTIVSTVTGIAAAQLLGHGAVAAGVAVGASIVTMSLLRCLHPSGGGCALLPVLGGPAILAKGYWFALMPAGLNALLLVAAGIAFHRFSGHSYPHRARPAVLPPRLGAEDIDAALAEAGEAFDVSREDLLTLFEAAERHAQARR